MARPSSRYFRTDSLRKLVWISNGIDSASTASKCCFTSFFSLKSGDDRVTFPRFERTLSTCLDSIWGFENEIKFYFQVLNCFCCGWTSPKILLTMKNHWNNELFSDEMSLAISFSLISCWKVGMNLSLDQILLKVLETRDLLSKQ